MSESVQTIELGRRESTPRSYDLDMMTQSGSDDYEIKAWKPGWLDGGSGSDKQALRGGDQRGWLEEIFQSGRTKYLQDDTRIILRNGKRNLSAVGPEPVVLHSN